MKILHLIDSGGLYGAEMVLHHLMNEQKRKGIECFLGSIGEVACKEKGIETAIRKSGHDVFLFRMKKGLNIAGARGIVELARDKNIDLIHCHGYKANILMGILPSNFRRIPYVMTFHGWTSVKPFNRMWLNEWMDALAARRANRVIAVSDNMLNHYKVRFARLKPIVIHNGIPELNFNGGEETIRNKIEEIRSGKCDYLVCSVGRLSNEKGFDLLVYAVAKVVREGHLVHLVLLGDGRERGALEQQAKSLGIQEQVHFFGYVQDAYRYLKCFDAFVNSSHTEGLPITLLEAMQAEIPVVSTSVGGIPEVLDGGRCGILVKPGDADSLAEGIKSLIGSRVLGKELAGRARDRFHTMFTADVMADKYSDVYRAVLGL